MPNESTDQDEYVDDDYSPDNLPSDYVKYAREEMAAIIADFNLKPLL